MYAHMNLWTWLRGGGGDETPHGGRRRRRRRAQVKRGGGERNLRSERALGGEAERCRRREKKKMEGTEVRRMWRAEAEERSRSVMYGGTVRRRRWWRRSDVTVMRCFSCCSVDVSVCVCVCVCVCVWDSVTWNTSPTCWPSLPTHCHSE